MQSSQGFTNQGQEQSQNNAPYKRKRNNNKRGGRGGQDYGSEMPQSQQKPFSGGQQQTSQSFNNTQQPQHQKVDLVVKKANESGFVGPSKDWFNDDEFKKMTCVDLSKKDHDYYFGSYSNFYIHEEMLKDTVRTRAYQKAIEENPQDFKDKIVLDIGCGTGILSIFAARAGAKHVYAIENAEIALFAEEIIRRNNLSDKITVIKGKMEEITLPVAQVDIIISEWMGYFLLYESMLDSVLWARDKYLVKGGKMLPDKVIMYMAAVEDGQFKQQKKSFWTDVYGVDMSCLTATVMREPLIDVVNSNAIVSSTAKICELDLCTMNPSDVEFTAGYKLQCNYDEKVHGLVAWWDSEFSNLTHPQTLSTSPFNKSTHWKQTVFYSEQDMTVFRGDIIHGSIANRKSLTNFRELDIKISYHIDNDANKKDFVNMYKLR